MVIAYLRVSTKEQNLDNQKKGILHYADLKGIYIDRWVTDKVERKILPSRDNFDELIGSLKEGDTLMVAKISHLSYSLKEIMTIINECLDRGVTIYSTDDEYVFDSTIDKKAIRFAFETITDVESKFKSNKTREALANRKSNGLALGRRSGSTPKLEVLRQNRHEIYSMVEDGIAILKICKIFNVSTFTFREYRSEDHNLDSLLSARK